MKNGIKDLIAKHGKKGTVNYAGKDRRTNFDEDFGKAKIDQINKALASVQPK